jgi:hypothetical protein
MKTAASFLKAFRTTAKLKVGDPVPSQASFSSATPHFRANEDVEQYKPGGYHPVSLGSRLNGRYTIQQKLGFGKYSTVWLAKDDKPRYDLLIPSQQLAA